MSSIEADAQPVAKGACVTRSNMTKYQYEWTISNFSFIEAVDGFNQLVSPTFLIQGKCDDYKWQLRVNPCCRHLYSKDGVPYISIRLMKFESLNTAPFTGKFKFSVRNIKKALVTLVEPNRLFTFGQSQSSQVSHMGFIERNSLLDPANGLLPNDNLTIVYDITIAEELKTTDNTDPVCSNKLPESRLPDILCALFESSRFSDVTLAACGREFKAHKAILAASSSVFSAMFEHEMKEHRENRVDIPDMDEEVLNEMLRFIYTEKVTNLNKMADDLLMAADKYQLEGLKALCIKELEESLSIDNAAPRLIIADLCNVAHLKQRILNFIFTHTKEVLKTESFNSMHRTHPHLINEALLISATNKIDLNG